MKRLLLVIIVVLIPLFLIKEKFNAPKRIRILLIPRRQLSSMFKLGNELVNRGYVVHSLLSDQVKIFDPDFGVYPTSQLGNVKLVRFRGLKRPVSELDDVTADTLPNQTFDGNLKSVDSECRELLMHNEMLFSQLKDEQYSIAIVDSTHWTACYYLVPHRLGISWVTFTDAVEDWYSEIRLPWLPSFIPHRILYVRFTVQTSFTERVQNLLFNVNNAYGKDEIKLSDDILSKYRQYGSFDNLADLVRKSKLFIGNQDVVIDRPKPTMPKLIGVGGMTAGPPSLWLSNDLQIFLMTGMKGTIFVSFGYLSFTMPAEMARKFAAAFGRLNGYGFLWKFKNVDNIAIPRNVRITNKFLPQQEILAHWRTRLFITHCGSDSQFEAIYHGVPMLGFPLNDLFQYNAKRIEDKGFGLVMNIHDFTSDQLYNNIMKILADPGYKRRITRASEIFRSAPQRPAERAVYWIEHVIKFGSDHLQSAGDNLELYEYYMLDLAVSGGTVCFAIGVIGAACSARR